MKGVTQSGGTANSVFGDYGITIAAKTGTTYLRSLTAADIARIEVMPLAGTEFAAATRGEYIYFLGSEYPQQRLLYSFIYDSSHLFHIQARVDVNRNFRFSD